MIGKQSETINQYFHKGSRILIDGSLDFSQWVDKDNQKRSKVGIKLNRFTFVDRASDNQSGQQQGYQQPQQQQPSAYAQQNGQPQQNQGYQQPQTQYRNNQGQQVSQQSYQQNMQQQMPNTPPEIDVDSDEIPF